MEEKQPIYEHIVIICREGTSEIIPFGKEFTVKEVEKYFDSVYQQWSDSFLCKVLQGPLH